jgi:hypothetical protein
MADLFLKDQTVYESRKQPIKRKCVHVLRNLIGGVPILGDVTVFLKQDRAAQDAVYTLIAMGYKPHHVVEFVASDRLVEMTVLDVLAGAASRNVIHLLKELES